MTTLLHQPDEQRRREVQKRVEHERQHARKDASKHDHLTGEDARMLAIIRVRAVEFHVYLVAADGAVIYEGENRHEALQAYLGKRRELSDFDVDPEKYRVRIWCDGKEFFCDQESWPPGGYRDKGKSCRQITGAIRPYPYERHMP